LVRYSKI